MCEGSKVRYFYFWCERCPTRITVETEVPSAAPEGEPEYTFAGSDGVGLAHVRAVTPTDDGLEIADLCPACGSPLHDLDDLMAREIVRLDTIIVDRIAESHAKWRTTMQDIRRHRGCPMANP